MKKEQALNAIMDAAVNNLPESLLVLSETRTERSWGREIHAVMKDRLPYRVCIKIKHISGTDLYTINFGILPYLSWRILDRTTYWEMTGPAEVLANPDVIKPTLRTMNATARAYTKRHGRLPVLSSDSTTADFARLVCGQYATERDIADMQERLKNDLERIGIVVD